ncbi:MAG: hypothetical protein GC137_07505 [Alphaproteobacteria bacterium]|nr:hypothetical protein [Alphaproteobacteria bacterium]
MKILFTNLGYARGFDGKVSNLFTAITRIIYTPSDVQLDALAQFRAIIDKHQPDLCCMVEIDSGSNASNNINQIKALMCDSYCYHDIASKYGEDNILSRLPYHRGKSNGLISRQPYSFQRLYFTKGNKRLVYQIQLPANTTLFFAHFSLRYKTRRFQITEMQEFMRAATGRVILMADFNILRGIEEIEPLMSAGKLHLLNGRGMPTFTFLNYRLILDLCLCSKELASNTKLEVIPQPFSDHDALLLEIAQ